MKHRKGPEDEEHLMFAGDFDSKRLRRGRCWKCGKRGHYAKDCKETDKGAAVSESPDSSGDLAFTVSVKEELCFAAECCYVDSGTSRHMAGDVTFLNNYEDFAKPPRLQLLMAVLSWESDLAA